MKPKFLLDASALLAVMLAEPGADRVLQIINSAEIHSVQLAEAIRKLKDAGVPRRELEDAIAEMCLPVREDLPMQQAYDTERYCLGGLSLGDRICLSIATWRESVAVTADRRWKQLADNKPELKVSVLPIR